MIKTIFSRLLLSILWLFLSLVFWLVGIFLLLTALDSGICVPRFLFEFDGHNDKQESDLALWLLLFVSMLFAGWLTYLIAKRKKNKNSNNLKKKNYMTKIILLLGIVVLVAFCVSRRCPATTHGNENDPTWCRSVYFSAEAFQPVLRQLGLTCRDLGRIVSQQPLQGSPGLSVWIVPLRSERLNHFLRDCYVLVVDDKTGLIVSRNEPPFGFQGAIRRANYFSENFAGGDPCGYIETYIPYHELEISQRNVSRVSFPEYNSHFILNDTIQAFGVHSLYTVMEWRYNFSLFAKQGDLLKKVLTFVAQERRPSPNWQTTRIDVNRSLMLSDNKTNGWRDIIVATEITHWRLDADRRPYEITNTETHYQTFRFNGRVYENPEVRCWIQNPVRIVLVPKWG